MCDLGEIRKIADHVFVTNVLPEIMIHKLQQSVENDSDSDKENIYCICKKGSAGHMIPCDNQQCYFKWFHYKCMGIKRTLKGTRLARKASDVVMHK